MKIYHLIFHLVLAGFLFAQDQPITNQYIFNPYAYNPSYLGLNTPLEFNMSYRRQWLDVADAPEIFAFNAQYRAGERVSLGVNIHSQQAVLLSTNTGYFTFGYSVPFSRNSFIQFGLSLGLLQNQLDINQIDQLYGQQLLNDPLLFSAIDNSIYISGQFGASFHANGFHFGIALPKILDNNPNTSEAFNEPSFSDLKRFIITAGYDKFNLSPNFGFIPTALFRYINDNQFQLEGSGLLSYKDKFWLGGGYRYNHGPIGYLSMELFKGVRLNYSYEFAGINSSAFGGSTNEIQLNVRLKKRKPKKDIVVNDEINAQINVTPVITSEENTTADKDESISKSLEQKSVLTDTENTKKVNKEITEPINNNESKYIVNKPKPKKEESSSAFLPVNTLDGSDQSDPNTKKSVNPLPPITDEPYEDSIFVPLEPINIVEENNTESKWYYVVTGAFSVETNASDFQKRLRSMGLSPGIIFNPESSLYYVYVFKEKRIEEATNQRNQLKTIDTMFQKAWIFSFR